MIDASLVAKLLISFARAVGIVLICGAIAVGIVTLAVGQPSLFASAVPQILPYWRRIGRHVSIPPTPPTERHGKPADQSAIWSDALRAARSRRVGRRGYPV
jgi:hypothetical protein